LVKNLEEGPGGQSPPAGGPGWRSIPGQGGGFGGEGRSPSPRL